MPPYTREEYLMYSMVELTSYGMYAHLNRSSDRQLTREEYRTDEMEHGGDNVADMRIARTHGDISRDLEC
jgi:hypothetical protein